MSLLTIIFAPFQLLWYLLVALLKEMRRVWRVSFGAIAKGLSKKVPAHGDAAFADLKTLKKLGHLEPKGWLVGVIGGKRLYTGAEASAIGMSPKGMGKTQTAIAQLLDIARRPVKDDVVVVDPAGDIKVGTIDAFKAAGYLVRVIDFTDPQNSDTYDPLSILDPSSIYNFDRGVDQFSHLVLPDDAHTREAHFQEFARILLAGTIAHMMVDDPNRATLYKIVEKLTTGVEDRNKMFSEMRKSANATVRQAVTAFNEAGDKEKGSFSTTMTRKLKIWLRQAVRALLETHEVDANGDIDRGWTWEQVYAGDTPTITYIITGLGTGEGAAARLILGNAINTRRHMWNATRGKFKRGLRLLVDESREIGNCQAVMDANNELRKAGVSVMMWFLSMRDVFDTYPQAKTLINNSDIIVFGGSKEMDYMEDVSRLIGEKTIENQGYSQSDHGSSQSASEQARRVMKADELRRMSYYDEVAVMGSIAVKCQKPFKIEKDGVRFL